MDVPNRQPDKVVFIQEYVPSGRKHTVSQAVEFTYGTRWSPPNPTRWQTREEDVPGHYETMVVEVWYTWQGTIGRKQEWYKVDSKRREEWYRLCAEVYQSARSKPSTTSNSSGLFGWAFDSGWGHEGVFHLEDRACAGIHTTDTFRHSVKDACPLAEGSERVEADPLIPRYRLWSDSPNVFGWVSESSESGGTGANASFSTLGLRPNHGITQGNVVSMVGSAIDSLQSAGGFDTV